MAVVFSGILGYLQYVLKLIGVLAIIICDVEYIAVKIIICTDSLDDNHTVNLSFQQVLKF